MTQYITKLALLVALAAGVALAQAYPQQQQPTQPTAPQTQQNPPTPDQTQPAPSEKSQEPAKVPQSDQAAASSTEVESNIQQAIKNDSSLAGSNIQVKVTNKEVDLSGTVGSDQEKQTAEQIAKTNAGPRKVKNHLKVSKTPSK